MATFTAEELLKFRLLADGVRVDESARTAWRDRFDGPLTLAEYATTSGVSLIIADDLYVNAPLVVADDAPLLRHVNDTFVVDDGTLTKVGVIPVPAFHTATVTDTTTGIAQSVTNYGVTHTDRVRVSPIGGCAWRCQFCDLPYENEYRKKHEDDLLRVIELATVDSAAPARHVLISGGTPRAPRGARPGRPGSDDEAWLDGVFRAVAARSPLPVDVMMPPRRDLGHPAMLKTAGVSAVSINLEISDPKRTRELAPAKAKLGREHFLDYVERAVNAFGVGFVQSLLVFGSAIEPLESTLCGVQDLADRGCLPVLSAFRPHHATPLADAPPASYSEIVEAYARTLEICAVADTGVRPGPRCVPCQHNTVTLPDDSGFYVGLDGDLTVPPWQTC